MDPGTFGSLLRALPGRFAFVLRHSACARHTGPGFREVFELRSRGGTYPHPDPEQREKYLFMSSSGMEIRTYIYAEKQHNTNPTHVCCVDHTSAFSYAHLATSSTHHTSHGIGCVRETHARLPMLSGRFGRPAPCRLGRRLQYLRRAHGAAAAVMRQQRTD